jgi:signal transduction histidine kinase
MATPALLPLTLPCAACLLLRMLDSHHATQPVVVRRPHGGQANQPTGRTPMRTAEHRRNPHPNSDHFWLHALGPALAIGVLLLLFLASGRVAHSGTQTVHRQDQNVTQTRAVIVIIEGESTDLNGVQAGAAGYIISGNPTDLAPYTDACAGVAAELAKLPSLSRGFPNQVQRALTLETLVPTELSAVDYAVRQRESGQQTTALRLMVVPHVEQMFARSRALVEQMGATEHARWQSMVTQAASADQIWILLVLLISLVNLVLVMIIMALMRRMMRLRERRADEQARAKAQAELYVLQEINRQMDEFISIAGHEFRTPLTTLKANLQLVARRLRRLEGSSQIMESPVELVRIFLPLIDRATLSTDQLERLTNDVLDVSRIEAGALVMRPEPLNLTVLLGDCVEEQRRNQPTRTITVQVPQQLVVVIADANRIWQTTTNYLTNALKFSGED